jgi:hypothetical protein
MAAMNLIPIFIPPEHMGVSQKLIEECAEGQRELLDTAKKITKIHRQGPRFFEGPLREDMLPPEVDVPIYIQRTYPLQRTYTVRGFNKLIEQGVDLNALTEEPLYTYSSGKCTICQERLQVIQDLADEYMKQSPEYHFGEIMNNLRRLKDRDLNALALSYLEEKLQTYKSFYECSKTKIEWQRGEFVNLQKIMKVGEHSYPRGDFSFISDPLSQRTLKNAFDIIERANLWHVFEAGQEGTQPTVASLTEDPRLMAATMKMSSMDGHTGASMTWVLRQLADIHKNGWEKFHIDVTSTYPPISSLDPLMARYPEGEYQFIEDRELQKSLESAHYCLKNSWDLFEQFEIPTPENFHEVILQLKESKHPLFRAYFRAREQTEEDKIPLICRALRELKRMRQLGWEAYVKQHVTLEQRNI